MLCKKHFKVLKKEVTREIKENRGYIKFCSKSFSSQYTNAERVLNYNIKNKVNNSLIKINEGIPKLFYKYKCEKCDSDFEAEKIRNGRKITCDKCKKNRVVKDISEIQNIYELSSRTIQKILKRANVKCVICDWDKTTLDIHHIHGRNIKDADNHKNLVCVCPNCHRLAHENKIEKKELESKSLDKILNNWKEYYNDLSKNGNNMKIYK